jgi:hypothetical protein
MKGLSPKSRPGSLLCPRCEGRRLDVRGHGSARCDSRGGVVSGATLEALRQIAALPETLGSLACECDYPEMRRLPDGTRHCLACGSEVVPLDTHATPSESHRHGEAWWAGWMHGHFGERDNFVYNPNLAKWEAPSDRLDYYRGHRLGSETRCRDRGAPLLARARKVAP